jgi:hypothetical protein
MTVSFSDVDLDLVDEGAEAGDRVSSSTGACRVRPEHAEGAVLALRADGGCATP